MTLNNDQWQEALVQLANAGGSGAVADLVTTGTITAAQSTQGTPVAGATVTLALGSGQATWEAQITGVGSGSTIAFDGVDDVGISVNWQAAIGYQSSIANPPPITSIAGPGPFIIRGSASGYEQIRVRCTVYNGTDTIAVRLIASTGALAGSGGLVSNDGTFASPANQATGNATLSNISTVEGATTDAAVTGDNNGTHSAKLRGLSKILADMWDSTNHWLQVKVMNANTNGQNTMVNSAPVVIASDQSKLPAKAASGDFADGAITAIGSTTDAAITNPATNGSLIAFVRGILTAVNNILPKGSATSANSAPVVLASDQAAIAQKLSAVAVYSLASTTTSGSTQNSGDLVVGLYREISIDINTTAQAGTSPTLQIFYERKGADGIYYVLWQSAVLTAAANTLSTSIGAGMAYNQSLGSTGRLRWVVGGSATPTWTFSANITGK